MATELAIDGGPPVRTDFLVFGAPCLGDEEIDEVVATLKCGWIGTGPRTRRFEDEFAAYVGVAHALGVSSCTAALDLSMLVSGVGPGDEVIVPSLTFAASANVPVHRGARPVFVDVDESTFTLDPECVAAAMTERTRCVIPVHYGGLAADLDAIAAAAPGVHIVEDAAHAVGTRYRGRRIGSHGNLVSFSFYANKNLTTAEGGMLTFAADDLRDRLAALRLHGMARDAWKRYGREASLHSEVVEPGYKYNLTDLQSAIGIHQLRKQERFLARREALAARYDAAFDARADVRRQVRPSDTARDRHALHLYTLVLEPERLRVDRDRVVSSLRAENIGAGIHYLPVHLQPAYAERFPDAGKSLPVTERIGANIFSLPITPGMTDADADDVIEAVGKVLDAYRR